MKLDRNQLAKDILLQHIDNMKSEGVCRALAEMTRRSGDTYECYLSKKSVEQADALLAELEK